MIDAAFLEEFAEPERRRSCEAKELPQPQRVFGEKDLLKDWLEEEK